MASVPVGRNDGEQGCLLTCTHLGNGLLQCCYAVTSALCAVSCAHTVCVLQANSARDRETVCLTRPHPRTAPQSSQIDGGHCAQRVSLVTATDSERENEQATRSCSLVARKSVLDCASRCENNQQRLSTFLALSSTHPGSSAHNEACVNLCIHSALSLVSDHYRSALSSKHGSRTGDDGSLAHSSRRTSGYTLDIKHSHEQSRLIERLSMGARTQRRGRRAKSRARAYALQETQGSARGSRGRAHVCRQLLCAFLSHGSAALAMAC